LLSCIKIGPDMYGMPDPAVVMYGMPANYRQVTGTVRGPDTDGDGIGEPIPGIQYTYEGQNPEILNDDKGNPIERIPLTDENGSYYVDLWKSEESVTVTFKDIDGEANGSFNDKTETIEFPEDKTFIEKDISLESK